MVDTLCGGSDFKSKEHLAGLSDVEVSRIARHSFNEFPSHEPLSAITIALGVSRPGIGQYDK
jgi:hypothetical protein